MNISHPKYLTSSDSTYDLSSLMKNKSKETGKNICILKEEEWPCTEDTILDEAQYSALKRALTKEIAIIQGKHS